MKSEEMVEMTLEQKGGIGFFEKYLTLWVALCIGAGIGLGKLFPGLFQFLGSIELMHVNLVVGFFVWLMIIPMLMKIDFSVLHRVRTHTRGMLVTLLVNWAIKPFSMAFFGWLFLKKIFFQLLPPDQLDSYIAGLILLAAAPCTAMVFVWSHLCLGDPYFTLCQVALNDTIMVFAFAPIVGLLLGVSSLHVPWGTLLLSVIFYILIPLLFSQWLRARILKEGGKQKLDRVLQLLHNPTLFALLATLILLFGFQGKVILKNPFIILLLAIPILVQVYFNSALAYMLNRKFGVAHCAAGPSALIGASNFFELAVATAISLYGLDSGAALATVVGVLIEVPVMLSVVEIVKKTQGWYTKG
ncbi:arsenical-resistance protein [Candidatus Methylacidiphilum fumarolicum]|uniref:Arsenite efflux pump ACR3 n=2 Tax=Candidatus Methylacidiphilum fumarolicum TaxID=591154 RepID=I0JXH8_METFB|nr:ACR3 family arsenite efflux transporter [Candidatus Methylacidiphilum fumarolicum]MBW6415277.1 ACR3 family arsenite efflux transporter [Candidatus Methylacidiphilum fumarolicum]TFE69257.1 arsenical-resistance protein [Candidatus Methylacidiphilum fumarolicum]TFE72218.1 arsenical-resistance protein [Candidatus Methylacidiphilum fumarolicum]TFE72359.1 arsenical-resistance protein [Candidatus Methylacidiphilum fumarolicum]TFE76983.1 arsenical-resistance protein [Candidatus Methylacidiphilum fu